MIVKRSRSFIKLKCMHCHTTLSNNDLRGLSKNRKSRMWLEQDNLGPEDIVIYRYFWIKNATGSFIFGRNYIGQSTLHAKRRVFGTDGPIHLAFKRPEFRIHTMIRKDFLVDNHDKFRKKIELAMAHIKIEVLQIIKFQGDLSEIKSLSQSDPERFETELNEAREKTKHLADNAEKFYIGLFHSQFYQFGGNVEEGGRRGGRGTRILREEVVKKAMRKVCLQFNKPKRKFAELLGLEYPSQEGIIDNNLKFWYNVEDWPFISAAKIEKENIILELFHKGYRGVYLESKLKTLGTQDQVIKVTNDYIADTLKHKFSEKYPGLPAYDIFVEEMKIKIIRLVKEGYNSYYSLLSQLPGFSPRDVDRTKFSGESDYRDRITDNIKNFIITKMGGITHLIDLYCPKPNYWHLARAIIRQKGTTRRQLYFTAMNFAKEIGLVHHEYTSTGSLSKKINQTFKMTWKELKKFILTGSLPDRHKGNREDFLGRI